MSSQTAAQRIVSERLRRSWLLFVWVLLLAPATAVHAEDFTVSNVTTRLTSHVYVMNAQVDFQFSQKALDALANGVPLTLQMDIEVQRKRSWLPDETVASLEQYYQLRYHALSHQYLVRNLNSGALYTYPSRESALDALGEIRDFPLLDAKLIDPKERYEIELRVKLDIESLPSPLRLLAYISPDWHLGSDWSTWSLQP
jgi:hypothetical protein